MTNTNRDLQFQIETDDTHAFREELGLWRGCGGYQNRPPPMVLETYLDTSELTSSQSLVIVDDQGKRWDVLEALNNSSGSSDGGMRPRKRNREVILERWRIELRDAPAERIHDFGSTLPTIYKKCIVFFRSLFSTSKIVPTWRFVKSISKIGSNSSLRVKCRILAGDVQPSRYDALTHPLYESTSPVTTDCFLGTTETPVGQIFAEVSYRNDCNFRVDDSEALLSSRFMGADERFFQPSIGVEGESQRRASRAAEVGSLPAHKQRADNFEPVQAYGSLSTFHGDVPPRSSSPISALRAARTLGSEPNSPQKDSPLASTPMQASRTSLRSLEGLNMARRPSVSFQPFKAGSLSSSPAPGAHFQQHVGDMLPPASPQSLPRGGGISALAQARNPSSLTAGMPATLRGGPGLTDNAITSSASRSPRPAPSNRYSSSLTHRRRSSSYGGTSKLLDDDQISSGKQSLSSSVQPGSGIIAEAAGASSDSLQTDDDNISEFLKLLDSKKTLRSFEPSGEASTKRTSAQLSKFQLMRESHNALTESISSSTMLHRSSSSSSRQLSSVPPMVAATSMSVSSSPGKPVSPHTPHTPAIPSRLSANSIAEYSEPRRPTYRSRGTAEAPIEDVEDDDDDGVNELGTNAIDIPTSPRPYYPHARRSSSVAQQHRTLIVEDDLGDLPFGIHRSISLGADDREPPSLSSLLNTGRIAGAVASPTSNSPSRLLQPAAHISETSAPMSRQASSSLEAHEFVGPQIPRQTAGSLNSPYRHKFSRNVGRGMTPPHGGSSSSLVDRGSGSERTSGRHSLTRGMGIYEADDEPLLFQMSEIGRDNSRRSIEEVRGGTNTGISERGGFEGLRGGDSGSSSRRASRRGW